MRAAHSRQLARAEVDVDLAVLHALAPHLELRARMVRANRQRVARCLTRCIGGGPTRLSYRLWREESWAS